MGALWLPSDDELVVAHREPNLLVPGSRPAGAVRANTLQLQSFIEITSQSVVDRVTGQSQQIAPNATAGVSGRGWYAVPSNVEDHVVTGFPVAIRDATVVVMQMRIADYALTSSSAFAANDAYLGRDGEANNRFLLGSATSFATNETVTLAAANAAGRRYITEQFATGTDYTLVAALVGGEWSFWRDGIALTTISGTSGGAISELTYSALDIGLTQYGTDPKAGGHTWQFYSGDCSAALARLLSADPFALMRPANQSPFLISIPGGGGAAYDETFSASSASALALSDSWALSYAETFGASAASGAEFTDSYQTPSANYDETFAASAASGAELTDAWALDYSETFAATAASGATLTDAWLLNYAETFAAASAAAFTLTDAWALDYAETFAASAASGCDLTHSYAVGNNYAETFAASSVSVATLTHAYSVQYAETFAAQALADCTLVAAWALDYAETFAASSATDCVLTDAYGTPAPGAFDETFAAAAVSACDLTHAFSTPAAIGRVINPTLAASGVPARTLKGLKLIN